jgi:hypothetical protein
MLTHTVSLPSGVLRLKGAPGTELWVEGEHSARSPLGDVSVPIGAQEVVFRHLQGERRQIVEWAPPRPPEITREFGAAPPGRRRGPAATSRPHPRRGHRAGAARRGSPLSTPPAAPIQ